MKTTDCRFFVPINIVITISLVLTPHFDNLSELKPVFGMR